MYMILFLALVTLLSSSTLVAEPNKVDHGKEIVFGQSVAFTGSMALYGQTIKDGINAYFSRVNQHGGVKGKKLRLISLDDKGSLELSKKNMNSLRKQGVTMFIGNMGTKNILALLPMLKNDEIALFFPWSGDARLRDASLKSLINGPGFMEPQLRKLVDYAVKDLGLKRVAIFHGDDSFSIDAAQSCAADLRSQHLNPLAVVSYNRTTLDVLDGANKLLAVDPRAIICIGTSVPVVKLINQFFEHGHYATTFLGIDSTLFVGEKLRGKGVPFYYTAAVPDPKTSNMLLVKQYLHDIARYCPQETPNVLSFTYYVSAAMLVQAIKNIEGGITHEAIMHYLESMHDYDLEGFTVTFDPVTRYLYGTDVSLIKG